MKNLRLIHFLVTYTSLWMAYCLFEFMVGNIRGLYNISLNFIPALLLATLSYGFFIYHKKSVLLKEVITSTVILIMCIIDQFSKIVVSLIFEYNSLNSVNVIPDYFSITPHINSQGSFIASRFNINAPFVIFTILNFIILLLIFYMYRFKIFKNQLTPIVQLSFIFLFSGGLCSLIDKIFWGGSLDFLHIHNLFIADIKDIFITFGLGSFILSSIASDEQPKLKDFLNFVLNSLKIK